MGFNLRRPSDFISYDYLKPTMSSMSRAKSVLPSKKCSTNGMQTKRNNTQINDEKDVSFDLSQQNKSPIKPTIDQK